MANLTALDVLTRLIEWDARWPKNQTYNKVGYDRCHVELDAIINDAQSTVATAPLSSNPKTLCKHDWVGDDECAYCALEEANESLAKYAAWAESREPAPDSVRASFKNFHRLLCERFGYGHDQKDWERDQLSLIEHIAKRVALLERIARLATELCVSVDKSAEDIGGERPALEILRDIGPLTDQLEKLGPGLAAGVGVIDLAGSSSPETIAPRTDHAANVVAAAAAYVNAAVRLNAEPSADGVWDVAGDTWRALKTALHEHHKHSAVKSEGSQS